jgi:hypothetical protein
MSNEITDLHPAWDTARNILAGIQQALRISIAGQVLLGQELKTLKKDLGFVHGGDRRSSAHDEHLIHQTWAEWVKSELGLSRPTADRMIEMFDAARARLKKISHTADLPGGTKKLALLFDARPSTMADEDREKLQQVIERITDGASQKELLEELRLVKRHDSSGIGGDTSAHKKPKPSDAEIMGQLAFTFLRPLADTLHGLRTNPDREAYYHTIPITSGDDSEITLTSLENDLEAALADVRKAKKDRMKPTTGKVIA